MSKGLQLRPVCALFFFFSINGSEYLRLPTPIHEASTVAFWKVHRWPANSRQRAGGARWPDGGVSKKKKKKAVWPPCGLLGVSPGSAGYSWSSDLCCWTPRAPSGRRTPPGRKKYHEGGKERKTKKMSSFFQLVVKIQYCIFFLPFKKKSLYLIQSSDLILRINFFIKGNKKWAGATFAPLIFFFHWSIS